MTTVSPERLRALRYQGLTAGQIGEQMGLEKHQVHDLTRKHHLTRWDIPRVLCVEIAAQVGVTQNKLLERARLLGIKPRKYAGVFTVSPTEAARLRAYYAELHPAQDYAHWLTSDEAAALLGIRMASLHEAIDRGCRWAAPLRRVKVRANHRWAYRYDPDTVMDALKLRRSRT